MLIKIKIIETLLLSYNQKKRPEGRIFNLGCYGAYIWSWDQDSTLLFS